MMRRDAAQAAQSLEGRPETLKKQTEGGRKDHGPFVGSTRCHFTADFTWVAELSLCRVFQLPTPSLSGFPAGHVLSSGTSTLGFVSVPSGS